MAQEADSRIEVPTATATAINQSAAGCCPLARVQPENWLAKNAPDDLTHLNGDVWITFRQIEYLLGDAIFLADEVLDMLYTRKSLCPAWAGKILELCIAEGLPAVIESKSFEHAARAFVHKARELSMMPEHKTLFTCTAARLVNLPAPPANTAFSTEQLWLERVTFRHFASTTSAGIRAPLIAALASCLPRRFSAVTRILPDFKAAISSISTRRNVPVNLDAETLAPLHLDFLLKNITGAALRLFTPSLQCLPKLLECHQPTAERFESEFKLGWIFKFHNLLKLFTPACDNHTAWDLTSALLESTRGSVSLAGATTLDRRVGEYVLQLQSAELRDASPHARTDALIDLIAEQARGGSAREPNARAAEQPGNPTNEWTAIASTAPMIALKAELETLNVSPLPLAKACQVFMREPSGMGIQLLLGTKTPPDKLLKNFAQVKASEIWLEALQETMCVDLSNVNQPKWHLDYNISTATKLVKGNWTIGPDPTTQLDLWKEIVHPLLKRHFGDFYMAETERDTPSSLFTSEPKLRAALKISLKPFALLGMSSRDSGSQASIHQAILDRLPLAHSLPPACERGKSSCLALLTRAGTLAYEGAGKGWKRMINQPMELVTRPPLFAADATSQVMSTLAECDTLLALMRSELELRKSITGNVVEQLTHTMPLEAEKSRGSLSHTAIRQGNGWIINNRWCGAPAGFDISALCRAVFAPATSAHLYCETREDSCVHTPPAGLQLIYTDPSTGSTSQQRKRAASASRAVKEMGTLMATGRWSTPSGAPKPAMPKRQAKPKPNNQPAQSRAPPPQPPTWPPTTQPPWKRGRTAPPDLPGAPPPGPWPPIPPNYNLHASPAGRGSGRGGAGPSSKGKGKGGSKGSSKGKGPGRGKGGRGLRGGGPTETYPRQRN